MEKEKAAKMEQAARNALSYKLYTDLNPQIQEMTDAEAGAVLKAISQYATDGTTPDLSAYPAAVRELWETMKERIDRQVTGWSIWRTTE